MLSFPPPNGINEYEWIQWHRHEWNGSKCNCEGNDLIDFELYLLFFSLSIFSLSRWEKVCISLVSILLWMKVNNELGIQWKITKANILLRKKGKGKWIVKRETSCTLNYEKYFKIIVWNGIKKWMENVEWMDDLCEWIYRIFKNIEWLLQLLH